MYILAGGKWQNGFCDYEIYQDNQVKVKVTDWYLLDKVDKQYISYPRDWRIVWNYLLDVGFRAVFLKLLSRTRERYRNEKFYSIGTGVVQESSARKSFSAGDQVVFFAPNHPECVNEMVLPDCLVTQNDESDISTDELRFYKNHSMNLPEELENYIGWSSFSGLPVNKDLISSGLKSFIKQVKSNKQSATAKKLHVEKTGSLPHRELIKTDKLKAALFGLGNYAKTFIIPNLDERISLCAVHEIDPAQMGLKKWGDGYMSTSPFPLPNHDFDVYFAAGYHHTHADIALRAFNKNAYAVIEKPVATTMSQIKQMKGLLEQNKGNFFACFHKRYSLLNQWVKADLQHEPGDSIDYFCIVYEIPLPERHWYNWPNAGSRILSNGCHWIDHFMFLNSYSPPVKKTVTKSKTGQINVYIELENKAVFSMVLTDQGSSRLGVRDYIELRKGQTTIYMTDSSDYKSENKQGWIRKTKINKIDAYRRMYASISKQIAENKPGDSLKSLSSSELVIELDQLLNEERP